jgi:predicted RNA polymerase sigma factor
MTYVRGWAADSVNTRVRLKAELDEANRDSALLREETRIKDARMSQLDPHHRPHYPPTERLAILELKAARGRSLEQTAKAFLVTAATIAS